VRSGRTPLAVTTSVLDPRNDFEINAFGTFNTLEAARASGRKPIFIYTSTNKVYGGMEAARIVEEPTRYAFADMPKGVSESWPLDFHSPYGCSKGTGDQYVRLVGQLPQNLTDKEKKLYKELAALRNGKK